MKDDLVYLAHMPQWDFTQPPMGIAYIGGYLRSKGFNVKLSDFSIEFYHRLPKNMKYLMSNGDFHINWIHEELYRKEVFPKLIAHLFACGKKYFKAIQEL